MSFFHIKFTVLPHGRRAWLRAALLAVIPSGLFAAMLIYSAWMPGRSFRGPLPPPSEEDRARAERLRTDVTSLSAVIGQRNMPNAASLEKAALYIERRFREMGYEPGRQEYEVDGAKVRNIDAQSNGGAKADEIIVLGAHYDSVEDSPGANDNASGVAATLEIARFFRDHKPARTVRFVTFVNEELPYFRTENQGSLRYARRCRERGEKIVAMICFDTLGYYSDQPKSQKYPIGFSLLYPSTGNFIALIGNWDSRRLTRRCVGAFRRNAQFPSEGATLPRLFADINRSDQRAFWDMCYPAIMVTDTAPFRYPYYHTSQDTVDKISFDRMARVVAGIAQVAKELTED
ncbi:MAG: M28 family peptidase [Candidatus Sumerlaeota bacterium]|nr:M28 family peptidase [Candidatus Sumerlaeota bacterium]